MKPSARILPFLVALGVVGYATPSRAQKPKPKELVYEGLFGARVNPSGLTMMGHGSYRLRLYDSDSEALQNNFVSIGLAPAMSPAWGRLGVRAELRPASVLSLWMRYEAVRYFGTFDLLSSFPSASADFSDSQIKDRAKNEETESYAASGTILNLGATLQAKVGPIAVRSLFRATRHDINLRRGDTLIYVQFDDLLAPNEGWIVKNDLDTLWVSDFGFAAGLRYTYAKPIYRDENFISPEDRASAPANTIHRLGALLAYQLPSEPTSVFGKPTFILLAQWHLRHRFRTGEDVSTALPYLGIAFRFSGSREP